MSLFQEASSAELIRSSQKDAFFMQSIRSKLLEILSEIFGPYSARYEHDIDLMAKLLYFIPTALCSNATLGEEYCSIKAISNEYPFKLCTPSILRRILFIVFSVGIPYFYNKFLKNGRTQHINHSWNDSKKNCYKLWNQLLFIILKSDKIISFILEFHLCYFYFYGKFYSISKYLSGIRYIYYGSTQNNNSRIISYSGLGRLLIIQFIISFIIFAVQFIKYIHRNISNKQQRQYIMRQLSPINLLKKTNFHLLLNNNQNIAIKNEDDNADITKNDEKKDEKKEDGSNDEIKSDNEKDDEEKDELTLLNEMGLKYEDDDDNDDNAHIPECVLCLSSRIHPTVTECGHIFCWHCIAEWCTTKAQCPLCKSHISHQKLIRLANIR